MKTKIFISSLCLMALMLTCNVQIASAQENVYGKELKLSDAEEYALKKPGTRASGKGISSREAAAMSRARAEARGAFAEAISAAVVSAAKVVGFDITQYAGDENEGHEATDGGEKQQNMIKSVAQEVIAGSPVVKTSKFYEKKTRRYTVFVCLEYNGEVSQLAKEVVQSVKQKISDEDRLKIDFINEKFEQEIEKQLNGEGSLENDEEDY